MISPGTAKTSLPSSSAKSAVIRAPLRSLRLDDHGRCAETGDDPVARRKAPRRRLDTRCVLGDDQTGLGDLPGELPVGGRVIAVDPTAQHRDGAPTRLQGSAVSLGVYAASETADDDQIRRGELAGEAACDLAPVGRARPGADDRHCGKREQRCLSITAEKEAGRRIVNRA